MYPNICNILKLVDPLFFHHINKGLQEKKASQTSVEILEEYCHADPKRRLDMYFMFPGLREKFDDMATETEGKISDRVNPFKINFV